MIARNASTDLLRTCGSCQADFEEFRPDTLVSVQCCPKCWQQMSVFERLSITEQIKQTEYFRATVVAIKGPHNFGPRR